MEDTSTPGHGEWQTTASSAAELHDYEYELADQIQAALDAAADQWLTPSAIARKVRADLWKVRPVLEWMASHQNGARHDGASYGIRHFSAR